MPRHLFFDLSLLAAAQLAADGGVPLEGDNTQLVEVPEWVNVLPEPDVVEGKFVIPSRDGRVLHIDSMEKLARRSNAALKKQKGGGLVDADHSTVWRGGPAIAWAEEFEARPGKGLWARADWLAAGEKLVGSKQFRYTSSVVSGEVDVEVDPENWSATWHIFPETVDGFAITNSPALVTTSLFAERSSELEREAILAVLLKKLGVSNKNPTMAAVRENYVKLFQFTAGESVPDDIAAERAAHATIKVEFAALEERIAKLVEEQAETRVRQLVHDGRLAPSQREAALEIAKAPGGIDRLDRLYANAPRIIADPPPTTRADTTTPHGVDPTAFALAQKGLPLDQIVLQLKQRAKEQTR